VQKSGVLDGFNFSNHRRKNVPKRNIVIVQYVHAVQDHEGQQIFVLKGTVQREFMFVQQHEGQQILVPKGPVRRELELTQILRKKEEERRGRKGERNVEWKTGDGRWEETEDRRREKGDVKNRQKSLIPSNTKSPLLS
jgi:hypothetical protein